MQLLWVVWPICSPYRCQGFSCLYELLLQSTAFSLLLHYTKSMKPLLLILLAISYNNNIPILQPLLLHRVSSMPTYPWITWATEATTHLYYYYTNTTTITTTYEYHLCLPTLGLHGPQRPQPTYTTIPILLLLLIYTCL